MCISRARAETPVNFAVQSPDTLCSLLGLWCWHGRQGNEQVDRKPLQSNCTEVVGGGNCTASAVFITSEVNYQFLP